MRIAIDHGTVAQTFSKFSENPALQESAQLFARGLPVAEMIQALAMNENVLRSFDGFRHLYPHGKLERGILEKVILQVSRSRQCQFCTESHLAIMKRLDLSTDVSAITSHSPREVVAMEYAEGITRDSNRIAEDLFQRLRALFSDSEIVELTFLIGFITMLNLFNNALGVRYRQEYESQEIS